MDVYPEVERTAEAIATMEVRGPAVIADAAAAALAVQARESEAADPGSFRAGMRAAARRLRETRPTAVSLPDALQYSSPESTATPSRRSGTSCSTAWSIRYDLDRARDYLDYIVAGRLRDGDLVMTQCHSTDALACVEAAIEQRKHIEA
jgi:ribose 1,5-bisphosphate isomerase